MDQFDEQPAERGMTLTADSLEHLRTASTWARILAILGFISTALILVAAIATFVFIRKAIPDLPPRDPGVVYSDPGGRARVMATTMPFVSLILGAVYFLICIKLYRFANYTRQALDAADTDKLKVGVRNLGSFFKTFGIVAIVGLAFYVIMIIGTLGTVFSRL